MDHQRIVDLADDYVVERPGRVVVAFLLASAVFAVGLGNVGTTAGTQQFAQDLPAERAFQQVQQHFEPTFSADTGNTQLIQHGQNVLAKPALLRMLRAQHRLEARPGLRVESTSSAAGIVATTIDPNATTTGERIDAVEGATGGEIDRAVRRAAATDPQFAGLLSKDFNRGSASASATIGLVVHEIPAGVAAGSGQGGSSPLTSIQRRVQHVVDTVGGDIEVFGSGIIAAEFSHVIVDTLVIVVPAAVLFILSFLVVAYRDLADLLLGLVSLAMALVWTFGFMGLAGIPFSQMLIAVPPLLLAVGIDFGIHAVNRYREETAAGRERHAAMRTTTDQLLVAFFIVTTTTVIGFLSNLTSALPPIRDFGVVASIGIVFTFLIFGVFLPAAKVLLDGAREDYPIPTFSTKPLGAEGSALGRALTGGVVVARRAPRAFLLVVVLASAGAGVYATDVDTTFSNEDFLPPEETPAYLENLPEPFRPSEYTVTEHLHFLEEKFRTTQGGSVTVYVEGPMGRDSAMEALYRAGRDPPESFVRDGRHAESTSVVTAVRDYQRRDPKFDALVARNDRDGDGIPDDDLDAVYDYLLDSPAREQVLQYVTADRRSARVVYSVKASASQSAVTEDARTVADRHRFEATATGSTVVFQAIADLILRSALVSLSVAVLGTVVFLVLVYWALEGEPLLGAANTFPILVTVAVLAGSMRLFGISFNAFTATILAITIGLGIDYSVHVTHRFADEFREARRDDGPENGRAGDARERDLFDALRRTVRGTGGALAGSMLTTVFGIGVLVLSIFPAIGQFGLLTGLSVVYSFLASLFVLPSALVVWARVAGP